MKMMFKCLIVVVMSVVVVGAQEEEKKDHNGPQHKALCDLMKAAVGKWGRSGEGLSEPLKKALGRTIFGKHDGGDLADLKGLPTDYNNVEGTLSSRGTWCGNPYEAPEFINAPTRWSGHSGPHGLLCLCTVGEKGWPLNESKNGIDKLCGLGKNALAAEDNEGWGYTGHQGNKHVTAAWAKIVTPCLQSSGMEDLKQALKTFLGKLVNKSNKEYTNRYQLGEGEPSEYDGCTGSEKKGVCVLYYNTTGIQKPMPWWVDLQNALPEEEKFQEEKRRAEEEKRKQQETEKRIDESQTAALTSTHTTTNQTDQSHKANLTDTIRKYNISSGTPISRPTSWLLSAALLI
ncbi:Variant surface glycoprotein [Trypanosoma congolense IL3000]|uniref:Variant surface glycoprotein n=1 Tax=Trypanosoma congolense (strain IL3000) TaxID=1068625 RepID=F9WDV9_TRYCI|nr:Variant surface glycoprotein [Trypanosoma congolense IL3000]